MLAVSSGLALVSMLVGACLVMILTSMTGTAVNPLGVLVVLATAIAGAVQLDTGAGFSGNVGLSDGIGTTQLMCFILIIELLLLVGLAMPLVMTMLVGPGSLTTLYF